MERQGLGSGLKPALRMTSPAFPKILRVWLLVSLVVGVLFALSQLAEIPARSALRGYDNTFNYLWLRSALVDGDWDFRNDLAQCDTLPPDYRASALSLPRTAIGRVPNKYGVGWAVLTLPFYLLADALVAVGRALGVGTFARDGWSPVYQICIQLGHVALGAFALWLAARVVAAWSGAAGASRENSLAGVILVWAASPLIYYQSVNVSMSHGAAFFAVTLMAYSLIRAERADEAAAGPKKNFRWWLLAGAAWGLAFTTRFQLGIFGLLAVWSGWKLFGAAGGRGVFRALAFFAAGAAPLVFLQLLAWHSVYGAWLVFSYGVEGESFRWASPELLRALFSPWHGLFYWHPFLLVALAALAAWSARKSGLALVLLTLVALTIYLNSAWWCWWFASAFGSRSFDAALLPLMAGVAWLLPRTTPRGRAALLSLGVAAGAWNFYVLLLYRVGAISRSEPVTWLQMLEAAGKIPHALSF